MTTISHKPGGHNNIGKMTKKQLRKVTFISQNMRGIKSENRLEELFYVMSTRNVLAVKLVLMLRIGMI